MLATVRQADGSQKQVEVQPHYTSFFCDTCKQTKLHKDYYTTGYGTYTDGTKSCFACCAVLDRTAMWKDGNSKGLPLYLTLKDGIGTVSNWPGTLTYRIYGKTTVDRGRFGQKTIYFRFHGPDGYAWTGFQAGRWTQIAHCKRTKEQGFCGPRLPR